MSRSRLAEAAGGQFNNAAFAVIDSGSQPTNSLVDCTVAGGERKYTLQS